MEPEAGATPEAEAPKRSHKATGNPRGRPKGSSNAPKPEGPPPTPEEKALDDAARELKEMKITPKLAMELGEQAGEMIGIFYGVLARGLDDPRWALVPEEMAAQKRLATITILVYGEHVKAIVIPVMLVAGFSAPLIARAVLMSPKEKSNLGGPPLRDVSADRQ